MMWKDLEEHGVYSSGNHEDLEKFIAAHTGKENPKVRPTLKFLNFRRPESIAVICLKFKKRGQTSVYFVKKMQME